MLFLCNYTHTSAPSLFFPSLQAVEAEALSDNERLRSAMVQKEEGSDWGVDVGPGPKPHGVYFAEPVVVRGIEPGGPLGKSNTVRVGDRIAKINGDWILCGPHAGFMLSQTEEGVWMDITYAREEPLPPTPCFAAADNATLAAMLLSEAGVRVQGVDDAKAEEGEEGFVPREYAIEQLRPRFTGPEPDAPAAAGGGDDDDASQA